jgi:hypothetical protein
MRTAVFTCVNNDAAYLPIWYAHYARWFGDDQLVVLDHGSTDDGVERLRAAASPALEVRPVDHPYFGDFAWYTPMVEATFAGLLERFDAVVFVEPDELLWSAEGLDATLAGAGPNGGFEGPALRATGFNVLHHPREPALAAGEPILANRAWWQRSTYYDKTLAGRVPLTWDHGFHRCTAVDVARRDDLLLVHLHNLDHDRTWDRHVMRQQQAWSDEALDEGWAKHLRTDRAEFDEWFYAPFRQRGRRTLARLAGRADGREGVPERIPAALRDDLAELLAP